MISLSGITDLAGRIPGIIGRHFLVAFITPAALLVVGFFLLDKVGGSPSFSIGAADFDFIESGLIVLLTIWLTAIVLQSTNSVLTRTLEGYNWPARLRNWIIKRKALEIRQLREKAECSDFYRCELHRKYPPCSFELPTEFGNTLRAAESYAGEVYGIDAIEGWERLVGIMPDRYLEFIQSAKTSMDFWINMIFVLLALLIGALVLLPAKLLDLYGVLEISLLEMVVFLTGLLLLRLFSAWASRASYKYGVTIKASFDLYRKLLAESLGYSLPETASEEREFWALVNRVILLRDAESFEALDQYRETKKSTIGGSQ